MPCAVDQTWSGKTAQPHAVRPTPPPPALPGLHALQVLTLEENPIASPERIATPQGAGWAAEWLYRKKYRSRCVHRETHAVCVMGVLRAVHSRRRAQHMSSQSVYVLALTGSADHCCPDRVSQLVKPYSSLPLQA